MPAGRVGRHDNFFDLGGTSLSAIHLLVRLNHRLSLTDMLTCPVLRDQARLLEAAAGRDRIDLAAASAQRARGRAAGAGVPARRGRQRDQLPTPGRQGSRPGPGGRGRAARPRPGPAGRGAGQLPGWPSGGRRAAELAGGSGLYLWGQGAGAAAALATAGALQRAGAEVAGVLLAWDETMPDCVDYATTFPTTTSPSAFAAARRTSRWTARPGRLAFVARAYRHDRAEALRVLGDLARDPGRPPRWPRSSSDWRVPRSAPRRSGCSTATSRGVDGDMSPGASRADRRGTGPVARSRRRSGMTAIADLIDHRSTDAGRVRSRHGQRHVRRTPAGRPARDRARPRGRAGSWSHCRSPAGRHARFELAPPGQRADGAPCPQDQGGATWPRRC